MCTTCRVIKSRNKASSRMQMAAAFGEAPDSSHAFSSTCTPQLEPFYSQAVWYGLYHLCYKVQYSNTFLHM